MRQAVRVGLQILLPRIRAQGKTGIQNIAAVSSTNIWAVGGQRLCPVRFKRFVEHWDGSTGIFSSLLLSPVTVDKARSAAAMVCGVAGFCEPVKLLCRENLALSTALSSVMSASKAQL